MFSNLLKRWTQVSNPDIQAPAQAPVPLTTMQVREMWKLG